MPKANKDGWIRHRGGKCPVEAGTLVDVRLRDKSIFTKPAQTVNWSHGDWYGTKEVMAWRPHKAEQVIVSDASVLTDGLREPEMPAAKYFDGPLQWRDRIHTIDFDKAAAQKTHEAAMAALDSERAELVAKLKAEGLALIIEPIKEEDSDQGEDMSDWRNWKPGDKLKMTNAHLWSDMTNGNLYELLKPSRRNVFSVRDDTGDVHQFDEADMASDESPHLDFEWHSRPSN